jgi:hypothetical protein
LNVVESFDVEVCVTLSSLTHVTAAPRGTAIGFGEYAVVVRFVAPLGIVTVAVAPVGVGVGEAGELLPLPHAGDTARTSAPRISQNLIYSAPFATR